MVTKEVVAEGQQNSVYNSQATAELETDSSYCQHEAGKAI